MGYPLFDLHRHLEGSIPFPTVVDLARRHRLQLPGNDVESVRRWIEVRDREPDLMSFIAKLERLISVLVDGDACEQCAYAVVESAADEGLDYLELRFSPLFMASAHGLELVAVVDAVLAGALSAAADRELELGLIGTLSRTYGVDACQKELDALLEGGGRELVAIDLAGDEGRFPAALFRSHFDQVRAAGLGVTVHAGEAAGPESMWSAIRDLGATRIGHGVAARNDPELVDYMIENQIGVEANLTSNVQTSTVAGYGEHPLLELLERGVLATINTDDPVVSGIDLRYELDVAAPRAGLGSDQVALACENARALAFAG